MFIFKPMRLKKLLTSMLLLSMTFQAGCALLEPLEAEDHSDHPRFKSATEHYQRALDLYEHGYYAKAKDLFHEYVGQYPQSPLFRVALYYLGHCYQKTGEDKEALSIYNRIVTVYGDDDFWGAQAQKRIKQIKGDE